VALASFCLLILVATGLGVVSAVRQLRAWSHARDAQKALQRRDLSAARAHLAQCLEVWPNSASTHFQAARTARRLDLYDEAETHLTRCQQLGGDVEAIKLEHYLMRVQRGDWHVQPDLAAALDQDHPDSILILEALAKGCMKDLSYARAPLALRYVEQWLERDPEAVPALIWHGQLRCLVRDFVGAEADYDRALELDPDNEEAHLQLAEALREVLAPAKAADHYEQVLRLHPEEPTALLGLARCRRDLGQADQAIALLDSLLRRQPDNVAGLIERSQLALGKGQPSQAEPWLRRAVGLNPYEFMANALLSECLLQQDRRRGSAVLLTAPWVFVYRWRYQLEARAYQARSQRLQQDETRLRALLPQVMQGQTRDPSVYCELGMIYLRFGQTNEAREWFVTALRLDGGYEPARQGFKQCQRFLDVH
jgi:tetratricopeptide (TPR) repeat protein